MNDMTAAHAEYSSKRPLSRAWRVSSDGHVTYADTEERAIELHRRKVEVCGSIDDILKKCANITVG